MADNPFDSDLLEEDSAAEIEDDFLFHLSQGGELLRNGRVVEAKEHLERATSLKPENARGQNLLAVVYFKLGLFQRAIELARGLVERYPEDATLRVNLAMVFFKAGQMEEAEQELRRALELAGDHENAHRYLGLVLVKQARHEEARQHFLKAGVRNLDRLLVEEAGEARRSAADHEALDEVAEQGYRDMEQVGEFRAVSGPIPTPPPGLDGAPLKAVKPVEAVEPVVPLGVRGQPFAVEGEGLRVRAAGRVYCRLTQLAWIEGQLTFTSVFKRFGGQETRHPFDRGDRAMVLVEGDGLVRLAAQEDRQYALIEHDSGSAFFIEEYVFGFSGTRSWENGRLPSRKGAELAIFHLFDAAQLVLSCPRPIDRRGLSGGERFCLHVRRLVGWRGDLVPRLFEAEHPLPGGLWIELSGSGEVLCLD
ncbi:MAG: tetratricopeptide repeat protein [Deltaproteobacteria bacterium]|nr:tetratricopeptide repeat protein [Deltaproteobacteria bacterium]